MTVVKLLICFLFMLSLSACGYRPLYGTNATGQNVQNSLQGISIAEVDTRPAQLVRNDLLSSMRPVGTKTPDRYKLTLDTTVVNEFVFDQKRPGIDRRRIRLSVNYKLNDLNAGRDVTTGKSFATVPFDVVHQPVADLQAESNATERAAREVANDIRTRLAVKLASP